MSNWHDLTVQEQLKILLVQQKSLEVKIARLKIQCFVAENPSKFPEELSVHAITSDPDDRAWDRMWNHYKQEREQDAQHWLDSVWDRVEKNTKSKD